MQPITNQNTLPPINPQLPSPPTEMQNVDKSQTTSKEEIVPQHPLPSNMIPTLQTLQSPALPTMKFPNDTIQPQTTPHSQIPLPHHLDLEMINTKVMNIPYDPLLRPTDRHRQRRHESLVKPIPIDVRLKGTLPPFDIDKVWEDYDWQHKNTGAIQTLV